MVLISKRYFVNSDIEKNSNKFWIGELYDNPPKVVMRFGRVGSDEQTKDRTFSSMHEAQKFFDGKVKDKSKVKSRRDSYTEVKVLDGGQTTSSVYTKSKDIEEVALSEIKTSSDSVKEFIRWLCRVNKHNILSNTTIKYDIAEGSFKTPLGVIDKECLDKARLLLDQIEPYIEAGKYQDKELIRLTNSYLRYIPQDLGGSHVKIHIKDIFPDMSAMDKQSGLIDSLSASISSAKPVENKEEKLFDTTIEEVDKSALSEYNINRYRLGKVYSVHITSVKNAYQNIGFKRGNPVKAGHGTDPGNALSILRHGLIIPKSYAHGRCYGHGIYMSKNISDPYSYATARDGKKLIFMVEAALGNYKQYGSVTLKDDSLWLNGSGYIVVPRCEQVNILYLAEFL